MTIPFNPNDAPEGCVAVVNTSKDVSCCDICCKKESMKCMTFRCHYWEREDKAHMVYFKEIQP